MARCMSCCDADGEAGGGMTRRHLGDTPFAVYVHWPFCLSKCPYCDFNSRATESIDQAAWRAALLAALDARAEDMAGRSVATVFFGGGTPSLMEPATMVALLERIDRRWGMASDAEVTLEANPGTADIQRFADFRAAGVNRLSIGIQALNDPDLAALGRRHDTAQALTALDLGRRLFPRLSFDLIYARPGQTAESWAEELSRAVTLAADHLSLYQLTVEEGTPLHGAVSRGRVALPDEDEAAEMFERTQVICEAAGLPAYEVSNHAQPGRQCQHNLLCWRGGDYLGLGPGAHGRRTDRSGTVWAERQASSPDRWLEALKNGGNGEEKPVSLTTGQRCEELVMMGLRLDEGLSNDRFCRLTGQNIMDIIDRSALAALSDGGFLRWDGKDLRTTDRGRLVLNAVLGRLLA